MRRREVLVISSMIAAAITLPSILRRLPSDFGFAPLAGFDGFRLLQGGAMSGGVDPLLGVSDRLLPDQEPLYDAPIGSLCRALFGPKVWRDGEVPIAVFTDFNCPYCKALDGKLVELAYKDAGLRLTWHDMPLLGQSSMRSARAALAARFLGVEHAAREYLWSHSLRPGSGALDRMAHSLNISSDSLRREVSGIRVSTALSESLTLGTRLGIPGTPATMVGRTLVIGAIKPADLNKLIALEREEGPLDCV